MKKIPDIINRLWNVCGQMEVGALLTWGSGIRRVLFVLNAPLRRILFVLNSPSATLWKDFEFFQVLTWKRKKMNTATKDPPQVEVEPRTPRSRILSLSTWAICDSTKAGGKKTPKYGRAHSASRAAVVWRWTWRSCSSLTVVYPLFSLKGRDNSLV